MISIAIFIFSSYKNLNITNTNKINVWIANHYLKVANDGGRLCERNCNKCLFGLNGQITPGSINQDIHVAANRVISGSYRNGYGLCFFKMSWVNSPEEWRNLNLISQHLSEKNVIVNNLNTIFLYLLQAMFRKTSVNPYLCKSDPLYLIAVSIVCYFYKTQLRLAKAVLKKSKKDTHAMQCVYLSVFLVRIVLSFIAVSSIRNRKMK